MLVVTCLLFVITAATVANSRSSDAAGNAMSETFAALLAGALWIALAVLLVMAAVGGRMVFWAPWALFVLVPAAVVAFFLAMGRFGEGDRSATDRGDRVAGAADPLRRLGALPGAARHAQAGPHIGGPAVAGRRAVDRHDRGRLARPRAEPAGAGRLPGSRKRRAWRGRPRSSARTREREAAAFAKLGPDSHLADYLPYLHNRAFTDRALEGIQKVKTRQEDAIALLNQHPLADLTELWQWNVLATREVCEAYGNAFLAAANRITKARSDYLSAAMDLEWQMPNLKWILGSKCDLSGPLERAETNIKAVADSDRLRNFAVTLGELKNVR